MLVTFDLKHIPMQSFRGSANPASPRNTRAPIRVTACVFACLLLFALSLAAQNRAALPQISRTVNQNGFVSAVGRRAALLGSAESGFEAWVYPLKVLRDLHMRFHTNSQIIPSEAVARSVVTRPESATIVYSDAAFQVRETLFVPVHEPGAIITFEIQTERPLEIELVFKPDFELEWPAVLGPSQLNWDSARHAFLFRAQNHDYAALVASPNASETDVELNTGNSPDGEASFLLATVERGSATRRVYIAASLQGDADAWSTYERLLRDQDAYLNEAAGYYRDYLHRTLRVDLPDTRIQQAYDWARINLAQALVENPLVGTGLIAGYGPSGATQRPGFDWFFGRDALWSSLALDAEGDFADAKTTLEFLVRYQRADGKIPHEIPQSATLVRWFEDYPYGYASADATPLFLIALCDYVERSGDLAFANKEWEAIGRAYEFVNSTRDADGFAQNFGVGHGWVESGPLLPVRTEIYQAAVGIEADRAFSSLARLIGKPESATSSDQIFEREETRLGERFWSPEKKAFAFAIDEHGNRIDETTVFPAVPMWFGLLDFDKANQMIARLSSPDMQTDWGMRSLSSNSKRYASEGYHFGSVWPLFTGWASVGEYRYHRELPAYQNLYANALLALDDSPGHVTEVLAGNYREPLLTSTPQQTWSAAMVVSALVQGLFGLTTDALSDQVTFAPHVPADWQSFTISDLHVGMTALTLRFHKDSHDIWLDAASSGGTCTLTFSPAVSLRANVVGASLNGRAIPYHLEANDSDQHVSIRYNVPTGHSTLRLRIANDFELSVSSQLPAAGSTSQGLRIISTSWTRARDRLDLDVSGVAGNSYELGLSDAREIVSVDGAELNRADSAGAKLLIRFPPGSGEYLERHASIHFAAPHQLNRASR